MFKLLLKRKYRIAVAFVLLSAMLLGACGLETGAPAAPAETGAPSEESSLTVPAEPVAPKPAPAAEPVRTESIRVRNLATNAVPDGYSTDRFWVQTPNGVRFQFRSLVPVPAANVK